MARDRGEQAGFDGINMESLPRWLRDQIDCNNESAGRDTGRNKRFFTSDYPDGPEAEKREKDRAFNALMRLLLDPEYARLYERAAESVDRASEAAARAAEKLARQSEIADARLDALRASAAELPDGRKVFKSSDGRLVAEDGTDVSDQADMVTGLTKDSPRWEEYKRARERLDEIERQRREVEKFQREIVDPAKDRLSDTENPPGKEELQEIIETMEEAAPEVVRAEYETGAPAAAQLPSLGAAADEYGEPASLGEVNLSLEFKAAHDGAAVASVSSQPTPAPKRSR